MQSAEIEQRIHGVLPDAAIEVSGEDCSFSVIVISDGFVELNTMKRQQKVLGAFSDVLSSGALHALTIKAYSFDEWNTRASGLVQLSL